VFLGGHGVNQCAGEPCCDTHVHAFNPPQAPISAYLAMAHGLGLTRHVFVQPSLYGLDNECQLQAAELAGDNARAIVALHDDATDADIAALHRRGARGVRLSARLNEPADAKRLAWMQTRIERFDTKLAGSEWCIEILAPAWMTEALLPTLRRVQTRFVLCHGGMFPAALGPTQPGFVGLLRLLGGDKGWIKLTGVYRWSTAPAFEDTDAMVHELAAAAGERLIWGSDHPHVNAPRKVSNADLLDLLGRWFPDPAMLRRVLVSNPATLFGFAAPGTHEKNP